MCPALETWQRAGSRTSALGETEAHKAVIPRRGHVAGQQRSRWEQRRCPVQPGAAGGALQEQKQSGGDRKWGQFSTKRGAKNRGGGRAKHRRPSKAVMERSPDFVSWA